MSNCIWLLCWQFFDRLKLFGMPAKHQPDFIYLRHVPLRKVHLFTIIQLSCLVLLWVIKTSRAAIVFPMMVKKIKKKVIKKSYVPESVHYLKECALPFVWIQIQRWWLNITSSVFCVFVLHKGLGTRLHPKAPGPNLHQERTELVGWLDSRVEEKEARRCRSRGAVILAKKDNVKSFAVWILTLAQAEFHLFCGDIYFLLTFTVVSPQEEHSIIVEEEGIVQVPLEGHYK